MMDYDAQLKIQAYLDGELPEEEARAVANQLAQDREAVALLAELRQTRQSMSRFEAGIRVPESREFYWSKIEREINRLESTPVVSAPEPSLWARFRRMLVPVAATALLAVAGVLGLQIFRSGGVGGLAATTVADSGALTYRDYSSGTTLVWLSYPAENEFAANRPSEAYK